MHDSAGTHLCPDPSCFLPMHVPVAFSHHLHGDGGKFSAVGPHAPLSVSVSLPSPVVSSQCPPALNSILLDYAECLPLINATCAIHLGR